MLQALKIPTGLASITELFTELTTDTKRQRLPCNRSSSLALRLQDKKQSTQQCLCKHTAAMLSAMTAAAGQNPLNCVVPANSQFTSSESATEPTINASMRHQPRRVQALTRAAAYQHLSIYLPAVPSRQSLRWKLAARIRSRCR